MLALLWLQRYQEKCVTFLVSYSMHSKRMLLKFNMQTFSLYNLEHLFLVILFIRTNFQQQDHAFVWKEHLMYS